MPSVLRQKFYFLNNLKLPYLHIESQFYQFLHILGLDSTLLCAEVPEEVARATHLYGVVMLKRLRPVQRQIQPLELQ